MENSLCIKCKNLCSVVKEFTRIKYSGASFTRGELTQVATPITKQENEIYCTALPLCDINEISIISCEKFESACG